MSNGVEVIVANDKTTLPGQPNIKLTMPLTLFKPMTLSPSTITNNMKMHIPQKEQFVNDNKNSNKMVTTSIDIANDDQTDDKQEEQSQKQQDQLIDCTTMGVIKTYFITYTHYNTMLINGKTTVMTNISTSSDIETDKLLIRSKITKTMNAIKVSSINEEYKDVLKKILPTKVEPLIITSSASIKKHRHDEKKNATENTTKMKISSTIQLEPSSNEVHSSTTTTTAAIKTNTPILHKSKIETKSKSTKTKKIKSTKLTQTKDKSTSTADSETTIKEKIDVKNAAIDKISNDDFPSKILKNEISNFEHLSKFGQIGLQSLKVLNPVINIMTDIIKNNLRKHDTNNADVKKVLQKPNKLSAPQLLLPYSAAVRNSDKINNALPLHPPPLLPPHLQQPPKPVYIPLKSFDNDSEESLKIESKKKWKNSTETGMTNYGILISPGEIISANPDLIIGRPAIIGPRPPKLHEQQNLPLAEPPLQLTKDCHPFAKRKHPNCPKAVVKNRPIILNKFYTKPVEQFQLHSQPQQSQPQLQLQPQLQQEQQLHDPEAESSIIVPIENPNLIIIENDSFYKTGQYFDDPSPYQDEKLIPIVSDLDIKKSSSISEAAETGLTSANALEKVVGGVMSFGSDTKLPATSLDYESNSQSNIEKQVFIAPLNEFLDNDYLTHSKPFDYLTPPISQQKIITAHDHGKTVMPKVDEIIDRRNSELVVNTTASNEIVPIRVRHRPNPLFNDSYSMRRNNGNLTTTTHATLVTSSSTSTSTSTIGNVNRKKVLVVRKRPVYIPHMKLTTQQPEEFKVTNISISTKQTTTTNSPITTPTITTAKPKTTNFKFNENDAKKSTIPWFKPNYTINSVDFFEKFDLIKQSTTRSSTVNDHHDSHNNLEEIEEKAESNKNSVILVSPTNDLENRETVFRTATETATTTETSTATVQLPRETFVSYSTRFITTTKIITQTKTVTETETLKSTIYPESIVTSFLTKTELKTLYNTVTKTYTVIEPTTVTKTAVSITTLTATVTPAAITPAIITAASNNVNWDDGEAYGNVFQHEIDENDDLKGLEDKSTVDESVYVIVQSKNLTNHLIEPTSDTFDAKRKEPTLDRSRIHLAGIIDDSFPLIETTNETVPLRKHANTCTPNCDAMKNEICIQDNGQFKCLCRNGFTRIFDDQFCKQLYTFSLKIFLDRYEDELFNKNTKKDSKLHSIVYDAINRMFKQSDLRDLYHGAGLETFSFNASQGMTSNTYVQFSDNVDETRLREVIEKEIRSNNFSVGGTKLKARSERIEISDFNECSRYEFNDCSRESYCYNLKGSFTCNCRESYTDMSENQLYPGRKCLLDQTGCEKCNYHGNCYSQIENEVVCECFAWYTGRYCHVNLKIILIGLLFMGLLFLIIATVCVCLTCKKHQNQYSRPRGGISFIVNPYQRQTLENRAMIHETCSEYSHSDTCPPTSAKSFERRKMKKSRKEPHLQTNTLSCDERDRSLTVMIPRVRCHVPPKGSPLLNNMSMFDRKHANNSTTISSNETKLLSYLDSGPKLISKVSKYYDHDKQNGALISAGFEVSAAGGGSNYFDTLEQDRSATTTLVHKISADLMSCSIEPQSNFSTFKRNSTKSDKSNI